MTLRDSGSHWKSLCLVAVTSLLAASTARANGTTLPDSADGALNLKPIFNTTII